MKNKFTMFLLAFIAGAIIGALIVWLLCCCCCKKSCSQHQDRIGGMAPVTTGIHQITPVQANTLFKAYLTSFVSIDTLKGFAINLQQLNAMQLILNADSTVHGFRIYMGMDSITPVRMVVGFGSPDHPDDIYETTDEFSGPCPLVCDVSSPITQH